MTAARTERCRCRVSHFFWTSARPCFAFLTAYYLSHVPVILFWSGSLRSFHTSLLFNRVRLLHLALIFNTADSRLLDWKLFTNTFCTSSLTVTNRFSERYFIRMHVNSLFVNKLVKSKLNKRNKNLKCKSKSIFRENNTNRQSWCRESITEDTTQHCQLIFHEIFTKR